MSTPESILQKIKLLLKLTESPSLEEADNAANMADKLISKYNVSKEELESLKDKESYSNDKNKIYSVIGINSWKMQLVLSIGRHYYCNIIQEYYALEDEDSPCEYSFFASGSDENINMVKLTYNDISNRLEDLIKFQCKDSSDIYIHSYSEGLIYSVKKHIEMWGLDVIPINNKSLSKIDNENDAPSNKLSNLPPVKKQVESVKESVNVMGNSIIACPDAYFKGILDGDNISLYSNNLLNEN